MAQFLSQRLQALKSRPAKLAASALLLAVIVLVIWLIATASAPQQALCQTPCLCRYCDEATVNGRCPTSGDGGCIGCAGACTSPGNCSESGGGGCGPVGCGCRGSDCSGEPQPTSPPATPVVTPTPPAGCPAPGAPIIWIEIIEPKIAEARYEPEHPVVIGQDPEHRGFDLLIQATGGKARKWRRDTMHVCDAGGSYPEDCPQDWHWECPDVCIECYDDPFQAIEVRMRLADSTVDWIEKELSGRYYGASRKEGLPRTWALRGVTGQMSVDQRWRYAPGQPDVLSNGPIDPGIHGGLIVGTTKGTPLNPPQVVKRPFAVPVYLLDTTIGQ
jgi:hypothetical protein